MGVSLHVRSCWTSRSEDELVVAYEFDQDRILIGRARGADVVLPHRAVSLRHASIQLEGRRYTITDHDSMNGTKVGGSPLVPGRPKPLRDHDRIEIGGFAIVFRSGVAVNQATSSERTSSLARRLIRDAVAPAPQEDLQPFLTVMNGPDQGRSIALPRPPARLIAGRGESCEIALRDSDASREHAELEVGIDGVRVRDLDSKNGVLVNGRAHKEKLLADRDELRIGATVVLFEDPAASQLRALEEGDAEKIDVPPWVEPAAKEEPEPPSTEEEAIEDLAPAAPLEPAKKREVATADLLIYVLASAIFAVSVLGLVWLMRAG